ncbi:hypothetical protein RhiirB3_521282 [Rhizophagus irregularis]|nr:hypothetical protein RhiirB3_521282 [Rhizophagus irregularis]
MKASLVIIKNFYILYLAACIGTEIWYLITLRKIGDYNEHGVDITMSTLALIDFFYFLGILIPLVFTWILPYEVSGDGEDATISYGLGISGFSALSSIFFSFIMGARYRVPTLNLGEIPFNCNYKYYLPENVKIACKARFISCTLGFSLYATPLVTLLIFLLYKWFSKLFSKLFDLIERISYNLQKYLFVL